MYRQFRLTFTFFLIFIMFFVLSSVFEGDHLYGFFHEESLKKLLIFSSANPLKFFGLTFITSFFIHENFSHLAQNLILFTWFGLLLERTLGHLQFLIVLLISHIIPLITVSFLGTNDLFMGSSLGALGLFSSYCVYQKKWVPLVIGSLVISFYPSEGDRGIYLVTHLGSLVIAAAYTFYIRLKKL